MDENKVVSIYNATKLPPHPVINTTEKPILLNEITVVYLPARSSDFLVAGRGWRGKHIVGSRLAFLEQTPHDVSRLHTAIQKMYRNNQGRGSGVTGIAKLL